MKQDDAGFFDLFEEEPIIDSGETVDEGHPDMVPPTEEPEKKTKPKEEQVSEPDEPTDTNPEDKSDEDVETKRYKYWQSKYDQLQKDFNEVKSKAEINGDYAPIAEFLYQNPQALLKLQEQLQESAPKSDAPQMPVAPGKPERPANYSRYEAMQDPESASAKYDEALMNYNSDMLDYMNAKQLYNEQQQYAQMQAVAEKERVARKQEAFKADLLASGLKAEEYSNFMKLMNGEESVNPKNLIAYYKILSGSGITKQQLQTDEFLRQQTRMKDNPKPAGSEGGDTTATPTDDEAFNNDMLNWKR